MKGSRTLFLMVILLFWVGSTSGQQIVDWQQFGGELELGYPVPIPVDTPLPFDGFRSYTGLFARHQQLMNDTDLVHGSIIGQTHAGRDIWAYRLGDEDQQSLFGQPEAAMFINAGIHAREWQTPETATGIMELLIDKADDNHLYRYLLDNVNPVVIPVLNVDGFLQTQRFPRSNWLKTDPYYSGSAPRDGRMRRKNMPDVDEVLSTRNDHLLGVDLNRNNPPFWGTTGDSRLRTADSLTYAGTAAHSEPETRAMTDAADLGPGEQLRMFADLHSFSQVHFPTSNPNHVVNTITNAMLGVFSEHHAAYPAAKRYFNLTDDDGPNLGTGYTTEFFSNAYDIPAWTLEIEPSGSNTPHSNLPGAGQDYGGSDSNGHSGFILPESQIRRVREQLAETFAVTFYHQAGPPALIAVRIIDSESGSVVYDAGWDQEPDSTRRSRHRNQIALLKPGRDYQLWLAFDKPMRARDATGNITSLQGQTGFSLTPVWDLRVNTDTLELEKAAAVWHDTPGDAPGGYLNYRDDAVTLPFRIPDTQANQDLLNTSQEFTLSVDTRDMVKLQTDANPETVVTWDAGWAGYERTSGTSNKTNGGADQTHSVNIATQDDGGEEFLIQPGISAAWFDVEHSGEGFVIETLADGKALMYWFTYDEEGNQRWFLGSDGEIRGNRIIFEELLMPTGGEFGPGFDPATVELNPGGSATFIWESCETGNMQYRLGNQTGRMDLQRLSFVLGAECFDESDEGPRIGTPPPPPLVATRSGSWFDVDHAGEGFTIEIISRGEDPPQALVYWFSYDPQGKQRWFTGVGEVEGDGVVMVEMDTTSGPGFGPDFDPADVVIKPWGTVNFDLGCNTGTVEYASVEQGFGSGTQNLERLSFLDSLKCAQ